MTIETSVPDATTVESLAHRVIAEHPPREVSVAELMGAWYDAGLCWVDFPVGLGGLGISRALQPVANTVLREAGGPEPRVVNPVGFGIAAGTIRRYATAEQAAALLRPLATGEELWCQLFSEPGAGSDLAGLATLAQPDGDGWRVNGQKVWNSVAHKARWGVLLVRTDPDVPKHKGLSYFFIDMHTAGVDVRPLRQITGRTSFNEVFLKDVYVPDSQRLGGVGEGWMVANSTLGDERSSLGDRVPARGGGAIGDALELWKAQPDRRSPIMRERLARLWMRSETHRLTSNRARVASATRSSSGSESLAVKIVGSELTQQVYEWCLEFIGPEGMLIDTYAIDAPSEDDASTTAIQRKFLNSRSTTLTGGTSEILRNVVGERVLKLPQEHRNDKRIPWRDVPRS